MKSEPDHVESLRETIREGLGIIVAGTGVSIAASFDADTRQPHPQSSWTGLLEDGLVWLKEHKLIDEDVADAQLTLLKKNPQTHVFISAAQEISSRMGGAKSGLFTDWLARTVGSIKARDRSILDALEAIRQQRNLLATTNYDGLMLRDDGTQRLAPVTWQDTDAFTRAVRHRDTNKVIFLHGYWRRPESVILDWTSYDRIARDEQYREDFAAFWKTSIWVYVGCGINGVSDPDFGLLLERYGTRARLAGHWDYFLVREDQRDEFQAHFDAKSTNIQALSFGKAHQDLPKYLLSLLPNQSANRVVTAPNGITTHAPIPIAPAFHAKGDYIPRFKFIGRRDQLDLLSNWAVDDDSSVVVFHAIGGNGKSALTWHWAKDEAGMFAMKCRPLNNPWAGRFWYSFYERGATMNAFCRHALAYMTRAPIEELEKRPFTKLQEDLLAQLHAQPWLLVLDGLERVLVHYHQLDPSEDPDEAADEPIDHILNKREPTDAIRDEDNDLLMALAAAAPSKILISTRLLPRVLLNATGAGIPGVRPVELPGLIDADAEAFLRSCGDTDSQVKGESGFIRRYLRENCDNHPLTIGALGGLIVGYRRAPGDFTKWFTDPLGGGALDFGELDLRQRRTHILKAALDDVPAPSRQLLSTLALLYGSVDYTTIEALSPHRPIEPKGEEKPEPPEKRPDWKIRADEEKALILKAYRRRLSEWEQRPAVKDWREKCRAAEHHLDKTLTDLTRHRGLLQYDGRSQRYEMHPVVRSVVTRSLVSNERVSAGERILDHFTALPHNPYRQARSLADLEIGLHIVRTLLKLGRYEGAAHAYEGDLSNALLFNIEAYEEVLSVLRPFFPDGWGTLPQVVETNLATHLACCAAFALRDTGQTEAALAVFGVALIPELSMTAGRKPDGILSNISRTLVSQNRLASALRIDALSLEAGTVFEEDEWIFTSRLYLFNDWITLGQWTEADATWAALDPMGRKWPWAAYRPGRAEYLFALSEFWRGRLDEAHLVAAENLVTQSQNRLDIRRLHQLRGEWQLELGEWRLAVDSLRRAVELAHESRLSDDASETALSLAKHHLDPRSVARSDAERLARLRQPHHRYLGCLWHALGAVDLAKHHALIAYAWAWADGEPYVRRYELTKTKELLNELQIPIPKLSPYDPATSESFPWEADVRAATNELRVEKERNGPGQAAKSTDPGNT